VWLSVVKVDRTPPSLKDGRKSAYPLGLAIKPQRHKAAGSAGADRNSGQLILAANLSRRIVTLICPASLAPSSDVSIDRFDYSLTCVVRPSTRRLVPTKSALRTLENAEDKI
jgi:hypothetical protein